MGQEYIREGKRFLYEESGIGVVEIILNFSRFGRTGCDF